MILYSRFHRPTVFMVAAMYCMRHNVLYVEMNNNLKSKVKPQIRASVHSLLLYIFFMKMENTILHAGNVPRARLFIHFSFKAIYIYFWYIFCYIELSILRNTSIFDKNKY